MDESETYANMRHTGMDPQAPSGAEPDVSYVELNVTALSAPRVQRDGGGLNSTYAEVKFPNDEHVINEDEAPPIAAGLRKLPNNAQTGAQEQDSKAKIGRPYRLICLLCLVTAALIVIVVGLSIHVSQIRQSLNRMHSDLRHQFTEIEMKYRSVNETKAQICELLTSRREQPCCQDWIRNEDKCYLIPTSEKSYKDAKQYCSNSDSKLLEIISTEVENFVKNVVNDKRRLYWIGKCEAGNVVSDVFYKMNARTFECSECKSLNHKCYNDPHRFICEKTVHFLTEISGKIQDLCQQPEGPA
ncbi:C-type lectin domain family 12 member A-like [Hypanus sabinus]|uniref:C-type lectin domain family 12 member A-like n=1 Tax=Hypanus sabinus TaxID=79690 RepID=UPI0028C42162|nr:C-type lectin domain family 12 member A-like [Hypanus sabinus]